ncbi:MAG: hypothetical protein ABSH09_18515 [Bryobacteraceae bacterium]
MATFSSWSRVRPLFQGLLRISPDHEGFLFFVDDQEAMFSQVLLFASFAERLRSDVRILMIARKTPPLWLSDIPPWIRDRLEIGSQCLKAQVGFSELPAVVYLSAGRVVEARSGLINIEELKERFAVLAQPIWKSETNL